MSDTRPVLFGEVLFDRFPARAGGEAVLGGAPFNVAWHLQAFGLEPRFLSRVGEDSLGQAVLAGMRAWNMDVSGVQVDPERPTGVVEVRLEEGEPSYEILADQAYDHIDASELPPISTGALLCHGTLALRAEVSRAALDTILSSARPRRLVDVNLRAPWWGKDEVLDIVRGSSVIKLNEHELGQLVRVPGERDASAGVRDLEAAAHALMELCGAECTVVTRGERGAVLFSSGRAPIESVPAGTTAVVDAVGAGDAFMAVLLLGEARGWSLETTLQRGVEFAEAILGLRGATTTDPGFYSPFLRDWNAP